MTNPYIELLKKCDDCYTNLGEYYVFTDEDKENIPEIEDYNESTDSVYDMLKLIAQERFPNEIYFSEVGSEVRGEKVKLPYVYKNDKGEPVETQECMVIYIHLKRMKQMLTKKNNNAMNIENRDMKTGRLVGEDKGGQETDREFESLATMGLDWTMDEFARAKADALGAATQMSNTILTNGFVSDKDIQVSSDDSLGKNMLNAYLLGAHITSNLVDIDYMTPYTAKNRAPRV